VLAIACGVAEGGAWARTPRRADCTRICRDDPLRRGHGRATGDLAGLSGLGDLVLTCSSTSSRNFSLGKAIGEGKKRARPDEGSPHGRRRAHTAPMLDRIAKERDIDMPLVDAVATC
jgi:glycerol-3-phosphate dehydrogenase (NAD(P)+)